MQFNTRYTLSFDKQFITLEGQALIRRVIWREELPQLPDDWDYEWAAQHGAYRGKFPKRVRQYYWREHQIKCADSFISEIGNVARQHCHDSETYEFEFRNQLTWQDGDFGDRGSCYWHSTNGARAMLMENEGFAMCFFNNSRGIARAWVVPVSEGGYVVFNGYGYETRQIARLFAAYMALSYKEIDLTNHYETAGVLYINNDTGYHVARPALLTVDDIDLDLLDMYGCPECGNVHYEEDMHRGTDDANYCEWCFNALFTDCYRCGAVYYRHDHSLKHIASTDEMICDFCLPRHFVQCEDCKDHYLEADVTRRDGRVLCGECAAKADNKS